MTKVSIVIPVYNVERYLRECLDSVINQTLKDIEIICVDDGSTDSSLAILNEYAARDNRITVLKQKNKGAGVARNLGLAHSCGDYLYFMDSDDYLELNALEKIYKRIVDTNAEICVFKNGTYYQSTGEVMPCNWEHSVLNIPDKETFNKYDIPNVFFQFCNPPAWSKLYKASFIKKNHLEFQNLKTCNDVYFNYMSLALANSITFLNETLLTWRTEHSCTTATRGKYIYCVLKAYKKIKNDLSKKDFELLADTFYKKVNGSFVYEIGKVEGQKQKDYWTLKLYNFLPKKYWPKNALALKEKKKSVIQNIFSVRNQGNHKVITITGIKIKLKRRGYAAS
ncbi:MAG: glycosyltransferase [Fusobacterium sp.]|nr:glycosyltransferase [Fusobacterium sp.]